MCDIQSQHQERFECFHVDAVSGGYDSEVARLVVAHSACYRSSMEATPVADDTYSTAGTYSTYGDLMVLGQASPSNVVRV